MANQPESAVYDSGVYQLETVDPVQGGVGGLSNTPLLNLANRTAYLKAHVDAIESGAFVPPGIATLASPTFTGTVSGPTATAGDNTVKFATTAFVQNLKGGISAINVAGNSNVVLTAAQYGCGVIALTGVITGNINIVFPNNGQWLVMNGTTGAFTITCKTAAGGGVLVTQGRNNYLGTDGTNVIVAVTDVATATFGDASNAPANTAFVAAAIAGTPILWNHYTGLTLSTAGASASFGIAAGQACDSTNAALMTLAAAITKTTGAWAVGSTNGSLDTGVIANSKWYHVFLIKRIDTGVVDVLTSLNPTTPALPASYTVSRRIGAMLTDGSNHWVAFVQWGKYFSWVTPLTDQNSVNASGLLLFNVPTGVKVLARLRGNAVGNSAGTCSMIISSPDESAPLSPLGAPSTFYDNTNSQIGKAWTVDVITNTAAKVLAASTGTGVTIVAGAYGWVENF
jgi:hypothetical protein